jgi:hypothetical protein
MTGGRCAPIDFDGFRKAGYRQIARRSAPLPDPRDLTVDVTVNGSGAAPFSIRDNGLLVPLMIEWE